MIEEAIHPDGRPRAMRDPAVRNRRTAMLGAPHIAPLAEFAAKLRQSDLEVPDFDPLDGGICARMLFLFEKPGPMTSGGAVGLRSGSGFISRDNDDPTAEATHRFMAEARIARRDTVSWNLVPWWNGTRSVTPSEQRCGMDAVRALICLLPELQVVVLVGRRPGSAREILEALGLQVAASAHPSPIVRATRPDVWRAIGKQWQRAATLLKSKP